VSRDFTFGGVGGETVRLRSHSGTAYTISKPRLAALSTVFR
jgi:hypothetical protein